VGEDNAAPGDQALQATVALDGDGTCIARARHLAADFLNRVHAEHGLPVSQRATDLTQLVVSELVTNSCTCRSARCQQRAGRTTPRRPTLVCPCDLPNGRTRRMPSHRMDGALAAVWALSSAGCWCCSSSVPSCCPPRTGAAGALRRLGGCLLHGEAGSVVRELAINAVLRPRCGRARRACGRRPSGRGVGTDFSAIGTGGARSLGIPPHTGTLGLLSRLGVSHYLR
jgi:hypothetical protein